MPKPSREDVSLAIVALLQQLVSNGTIASVGRRLKALEQIEQTDTPILFLVENGGSTHGLSRGPYNKKYFYKIVAITSVGQDPDLTPAIAMNKVLDAIEEAFQVEPIVQTLGGLVREARIEGETKTDEGFFQDKSVAEVPISVLVGSTARTGLPPPA